MVMSLKCFSKSMTFSIGVWALCFIMCTCDRKMYQVFWLKNLPTIFVMIVDMVGPTSVTLTV